MHTMNLRVTDLAAGTAGEHIVCADLLLMGYRAFRTEQVCAYDVAVDMASRLVRVQVKTTREPRATPQRVGHHPGYIWHVRRTGRAGRRSYDDDAFDLIALVALDTREIAYMPLRSCPKTVLIRPTTAPGYRRHDPCAGCGCPDEQKTKGCAVCRSRHWRRAHGVEATGKRFADFPLTLALDALQEGGDAECL